MKKLIVKPAFAVGDLATLISDIISVITGAIQSIIDLITTWLGLSPA